MLSPPTSTTTVLIYDRDGAATIENLAPRERLAACYRWATARDLTVLGQVCGYGGAGMDFALDALLDQCASTRAALLVYSRDCLAPDPALVAEVTERLGELPILTAREGTAQ